MRGADALFVNIGAVRGGLGDLLAAARDAGVSKVILLSSTTVRDQGDQVSALGAQHKLAEDAVRASGIDWTVLRCSGFATNTLAWAATVRTDGVVRAPYGQAAMALIAEQDIAGAAVRTLLDPGHGGHTYYLTGQQSLTQVQQAAAIGTAIGRPVRFEDLPPETFRQSATQRFPAPVVDDLLRTWAASVGQTPTSHPTSRGSSGARPPATRSGPPSTPMPTADALTATQRHTRYLTTPRRSLDAGLARGRLSSSGAVQISSYFRTL